MTRPRPSPLKLIELEEQRDCWFAADALEPADAIALASDKRANVRVIWPSPISGNRWCLRPQGWVGTIPLHSNLMLRVTPKFPMNRLLELEKWANHRALLDIPGQSAPLHCIEDLLETALRTLTVRLAGRMAKGLAKGYVQRQMEGLVPRGRILPLRSAVLFASGRVRLAWVDHSLTTDIEDNQIVAWTLRRAVHLSLRDHALASTIRRLDREFTAIASVHPFSHVDCLGRTYDRGNDDYAGLHNICGLILKGMGPTPATGTQAFPPFGLDVPYVFQSAVGCLLSKEMPTSLSLKLQTPVFVRGGIRLVPDILISRKNGPVLAVMDTKYRDVITQTDLYQIITYATALNVTVAILIFPANISQSVLEIGNIKLYALEFDIDIPAEDAGKRLASQILELICSG